MSPRARRSRLFVVMLAAAVVLAGAGNPNDGVSPAVGEIIFSRSPDLGNGRRPDLYVARPDGSHVRLLVRNGTDPAGSPRGRLIAFVRDGAIWVMNRDGSRQHAVTKPVARPTPKGQYPGIWDYGPAWSADGRTIYFTRDVVKTDTASLYRVDADGTALRRLTFPKPTDDGHCHDNPSPSPNGRLIAFSDWGACRHGTSSTIAAITTAGGAGRLPFRFPRASFDVVADPAWAPNGRLLAYMTMDLEVSQGISDYVDPPQAIWVSRSDTSAARRVVDKNHWVESPAWSPDSKWIVFTRTTNDNYDIWRVRPDGSALQPVTGGRADDSDPAWLPPDG